MNFIYFLNIVLCYRHLDTPMYDLLGNPSEAVCSFLFNLFLLFFFISFTMKKLDGIFFQKKLIALLILNLL